MANPSTLSVTTLTIGSAATFSVTAESSSYKHSITYNFLGTTGNVATMAAGVTTATWTPPTSFYNLLPNYTSGPIQFTLTTLTGSNTVIGSRDYQKEVYVGSSIKPSTPSITLEPVNTNAWINSQNLYVGGFTKLKVTSSATAGSGASIANYQISGAFSSAGSPATSSIPLKTGPQTVGVTAIDTRSRTNYNEATATFLAYAAPTLSAFTASRGTYAGGTWTSNPGGDHIRVTAVGDCSLSNEGNTTSITVKINNNGPQATSGNYYYFTNTLGSGIYTVVGTVTDSVGMSTTKTLNVPSVEVPFNIDVDLPGIGVGMIAQTSRRLEVAPTWELYATGVFSAKADQWLSAGGETLDMNNSDITEANGIYWADAADGADEGLHFYRDGTNWDSIYARNGVAYFMPNHTASTASTAYKILTSNDAADYIVDKYTTGSWTVVKYDSGTAECWGVFPTTINGGNWSAWGSLYEGTPTSTLAPSYPSGLFTETPELQATVTGSAGACGIELYSTHSKTQAPTIIVLRPNSYSSNATYSVNLHAIGKWK